MNLTSDGNHRGLRKLSVLATALLIAVAAVIALLRRPTESASPEPLPSEYSRSEEDPRLPKAPPAEARSAAAEAAAVDPLEAGRKPVAGPPKSDLDLKQTSAFPITVGSDAGPDRFRVQGRNSTAFFTDRGLTLAVVSRKNQRGDSTVSMNWGLDGAREVRPRGEGEMEGRVNRMTGDPSTWRTGLPTYSKVVYDEVKPGIGLTFEAMSNQVKYTVTLASGADPKALRFTYEGADDVQVSADGAALEVLTVAGVMTESQLICWQETGNGRVPVGARYVKTGSTSYAIELGGYDPALPVTVDPVLNWSTYLGGEKYYGGGEDYSQAIIVDTSFNAYVGGYTYAVDYPTTAGVIQTNHQVLGDGFVAKFNGSGVLQWSTYFGGNQGDVVANIKLDAAQNPILLLRTSSSNLPTTGGAFQASSPAANLQQAYVAKLNAATSALTWATYLGGTLDSTYAYGMAVGPSDNVFVTGYTYATDFPTTVGAFDTSHNGGADVFVTKLNSTGTSLLYSTFMGGSSSDVGYAIAVDSNGAAYVTGYAYAGFPTTVGSYHPGSYGSSDVFVTKLNPAGSAQAWSTYIGGSSSDYGYDICLDGASPPNPIVTGYTYKTSAAATDYPTTIGPVHAASYDAFVTKVASNGASLAFSRYLGGNSSDYGYGIACETSSGDIYVLGSTYSSDFPMAGTPYDNTSNGGSDFFVTRMSSGGTLGYSTYLGGTNYDDAMGIAQYLGWVWVTGTSSSTNFPTTAGVYSTTLSGYSDTVVARFNPYLNGASSLMFSTYVGGAHGQGSTYGQPNLLAMDAAGNAYVGGYTEVIDFPTTVGSFQPALNGQSSDLIVTKIGPGGSAPLVWSTYLGGTNSETPTGLVATSTGEVVIAGYTYSTNYPTTVGAYRTVINGSEDGFVTKINNTGASLAFSTYLGGSNYEYIQGVALAPGGDVYVGGTTYSSDFPVTAGVYKTFLSGSSDVFVTRIAAAGNTLNWSSYLGGSSDDYCSAIAVDASSRPHVAGYTYSADFPTTAGVFNTVSDGNALFVTKMLNSGLGLFYSTFFGGSSGDEIRAITVDASAQPTIAGSTSSSDFPVLAGYQMTNRGGYDGFVAKLNSNYSALLFGTYIGGTSDDIVQSMAVDPNGNIYLTGYTLSANYPTTAPLDTTINTGYDAFVTRLDPVAATLSWSTFAGGSSDDYGFSVAVNASGNVTAAGQTYSTDFPTTLGAFQSQKKGYQDLWVLRIDNEPPTAPGSLAQYRSNGTTVIGTDGATNELTVIMKGLSTDPEGDKYKLQIEVRPVGVAFTSPVTVTLGTDFFESALTNNATTATVTVTGRSAGTLYHWQARSVDAAGRASNWTPYGGNTENPPTNPAANDFQVDTTAPTLSITSPTGTGTYYTNLNSVTLGGTSADNVQVFSVSWVNAATTLGGNATGTTSWTAAGITLATGSNVITVTATDTAGNIVQQQINVIKDTSAPTVTITGPTSSPTYVTNATQATGPTAISGTYSDNIAVTNITYSNAANGANGTAGFGGGTFTVPTFNLAVGINNITVTAFDAAGNSSVDTIAVTSDPGAPVVTITGPTAASTYATNAASIVLSGTASDATTSVTGVTYINTTTTAPPPTAASGTTTWTTGPIILASGNNVINVVATDAAGNQSTDTITVALDNQAPSVVINSPTAAATYITNSSSVALGGTASDTGTAGLKDITWSNAATSATGTASGTTNWTIAAIGLVAGSNSITVTATDNAGNTSTDNLVVTYDSTPPTVVITGPTSSPTLTTSGSNITLTGTVSDSGGGSIQSMAWSTTGSVTPSSGTVNFGGGAWSIPNPQVTLAAGVQTITITATDTAGNSSFDTITVTRDNTPPSLTVSSPAVTPFYQTAGTITVSGSASDTSGITSVTYTLNGGASQSATGTTSWSIPSLALPLTTNDISITATDGAGNTNVVAIQVIRDTTAPTVAITTNGGVNFATNNPTLALAGTASDNFVVASVAWQNNLGSFNAATGTTNWTASIPLSPGSNAIVVRATDGAGTTSTASITVTLDQTAPTVTITGPTSAPTLSVQATSVTISGTYSDAGGGSVASVNWTTTGAAPFSGATTLSAGTFTSTAAINLAAGAQTITVTATDTAGNTSTDSIIITRDDVAPSVSITSPATSPFFTTASSVALSGVASDNNALSAVEYRVLPSATFLPASGTTSWSVASAALAAGANTIEVRATDLSGRQTTTSTVVTRDNTNPGVVITTMGGADFTTNTTPLALAGTASDNIQLSAVAWQNNGGSFNAATGTASWTASIPLSAGTNTIVVRSTDAAGNIGTATITVTYDSGAPIITVTTPATSPFVTSAATISLLGTASDPSGVQKVEYRLVPAAFANATGTTSWSTPAITLAAGSNTIEIRATDNGNNPSTTAITVIQDTTGPTVAITGPTGSANYATSANSITLSGTVSDVGGGTVASVTWNNPSAPSSGTSSIVGGTWTATAATTLVAGSQLITVTATDSVGNFTTTTLTVFKDNTAPTISITAPTTPHLRNTTPVAVTGTAADTGGSGVTSVSWSRAEGGGASGGASGTTAWNASVPLVLGTNTITFTSTDAAGNTSIGAVLTVTLDQSNPTVVITSPTSAVTYSTNVSPVTLAGTVSDSGGGSVASVTWNNAANGSNGGSNIVAGNWTATSGTVLAAGSNVVTVTATDTAGNTSTDVITITLDNTAPTVTVSSPVTPAVRGSTPVAASGTAADPGGSGVFSVQWTRAEGGGALGTATGTTSWTASLPCVVGVNTFTFTATDNAGNITSPGTVLVITLDQTGPTVAITGPVATPTYATNANPRQLTLSGTVSDTGGGTVSSVAWSNSAGGSGTATVTGGTWTADTVTTLVDGSQVITVTATDSVGNTGTDTLTVVSDIDAPTVTITSPTASPTHTTGSSPITLGGTASDLGAAGVTSVSWSNAQTGGSGTATGTTTWSASIALNPGPANNITVTATDAAGNTSTDVIAVTLNTNAPTLTITSPTAASTYFTSAASITLGGVASDDVSVTTVEYSTDGTNFFAATGTTSWTTPSIPLAADGTYTITVRAFDGILYGSDTLTVIRDTAQPAIAVTTNGGANFATNTSPVALAGTASDTGGSNLTSVAWTNAATSGSGAATGTTTWTGSIPLTPGANLITFTATDGAGNVKTASITVTYDVTAPTVTITGPTSSPTYQTASASLTTLAGTASDAVGLANVQYQLNGGAFTATAGTPAAWTVASITLAAGVNTIVVRATDTAGNTSTDTLTVTLDATAPTVSITSPATGFVTNDSPVTLQGIASDNLALQSITWSNALTAGSGTATGTTSWTATGVALAAGVNAITVTATDTLGNTASAVVNVTYDPTAPTLTISNPATTNVITNAATISLAGTSSDNVAVASVTASNAANSATGTPSGTTAWTISNVNLVVGVNLITVTATDTAGNITTKVVSVVRDAANPTVNIVTPTNGATYLASSTPLLIGGTASDNVQVATVTWVNSLGGSGTATGTTTWGASVALSTGSNVITVTATDTAGNTAAAILTVTYDNSPPSVAITTPPGATFFTNSSPVALAGTASDAQGIASVKWSNAATGGTGFAAISGGWSASVPLAIGANAITVTATDGAGNTNTAVVTVTLDTTVPAVTITGPTNSPTHTTSGATIPLSGTTSDNIGVASISWSTTGAVAVTSGTTTPSGGLWNVASIDLAAGSQDITVTATDSAGNTSTDTLTVVRDDTIPTISITSPTASGSAVTGASTLIIGGIAADNVDVASVAWSRLEGPPAASGAAAGTTSWSATVPLLVGTNTFGFTATDTAGNTSTVATIVVTRDTTVPSVAITGPTAAATWIVNASPVALSGTASDADGIASVAWSNAATGGSGTATYSSPNWNTTVPLVIGVNTITVTATDTAGNTSTDTLDVTLDIVVPVVTITGPTGADTAIVSGNSITLSGSASDASGITTVTALNSANASTGTPSGTTAWTVSGIALAAGVNIITVTATDGAGNTSTDVITVTSDGTPPAVQITGPTSSPTYVTNVNPLTVSGTASDNLSVASVSWSNSLGGSGAATGTAAWSASIPLSTGSNVITITVLDTAGGSNTAQITVDYDNTNPTVAFAAPTAAASFITNVAPVVIGGTASDGVGLASVTWSNAGTGGMGTATGTTAWSASVPLANGLNTITVTATDTAGNVATDTLAVTFDAVLPNVTITAPTASPTHLTSAATLPFGGTASDAVGVAGVTCVNAANGATGTVVGTVSWSVATLALVPGDNPITVTVTDTAGNTNTDTIVVTRDSTAPSVAFTMPGPGPNALTNSSPLAIGGTASDNLALQSITWSNPAASASGAATGLASWTAAVPLAPAVTNVITVTATDTAGNTATAVLNVTLDTTDPTISTTGPTNQPTYSTAISSVTLSGTAADAGGLSTVTWVNTSTGATGTATGTTNWSAAVALTPGTNFITITVVDAAGNTATNTITVIHDTQTPTITISTPTSAALYNSPTSPLTIGGTASDNVGVTSVTWTNGATGGSGTAAGTTNWSMSVPLVQGNNQITVTSVDDVGNSSSDTITVSYDPVAPTVTITSPTAAPTYSTTNTPLDISGTASDNLSLVSVTWSNTTTGTTGTAIGTTAWTSSISLTSGPNTIVFTATDTVGNVATDTIVVTYDITPPLVTIVSPAPPTFTTQSRPLAISGTASDNVGVASVTWSNSLTGSNGPATGTTSWSASIPLVPGTNLITIRAVDDLGNVGSTTLSVDYSHETVAPSLVIVSPAPPTFTSPNQLVTVAGTAADNVGVTKVTWINQATSVYGTASGTTAWSADIPLADGANLIQVTAYDDVGNTLTAAITITYTALLETNAPSITITAPTTSDTFNTTVSPAHIEADALDDVGIVSVHWTNQGTYGDGDSGWGTFWYADIPLVAGANLITMTAVDTSGNTSTDAITITYSPPVGDPVPPTVSITSPLATGTYESAVPMVNLAGVASDNTIVDSVTFSNAATGAYATAVGTTAWSASNVTLNVGVNVITARAVDPSGNVGQSTLVVVYTPPAAAKPVAPVIPAGMCGCTGLELLPLLGAVWLGRKLRRRKS